MTVYSEYQAFKQPRGAASAGPATPSDIEGPFYRAGAPFRNLLCEDVQPTLQIVGAVVNTAGEPIVGAVLDFWQADAAGVYDMDGFNFRGRIGTAGHGDYAIQTVRPGDYKIADDPPDFRCAHIHVKVTAPGYKPLTTQLYFPDDKHNETDHWFDKRRVIEFEEAFGGIGVFKFVLEKE